MVTMNTSSVGPALSHAGWLQTGEASATSERPAPPLLAQRQPADWLAERLEAIESLLQLDDDWDSYGARRIDARSVRAAQDLVRWLAMTVGVERPAVAASPDGFVGVSWEWANHAKNLDVEVLPQGGLAFCYLDDIDGTNSCEGTTGNWPLVAQLLTRW